MRDFRGDGIERAPFGGRRLFGRALDAVVEAAESQRNRRWRMFMFRVDVVDLDVDVDVDMYCGCVCLR